jgi:glutamyl-tRNA synthetase
LAPSPTGHLHLGHARTFWCAQQRAWKAHGTLVLRNEDLDKDRCKPGFVRDMIEDMRWLGLRWSEGPDCGGPYGPYHQSERFQLYQGAFERLKDSGLVYPCVCSRQDILRAAQAPNAGDDELIYPGTCRIKPVIFAAPQANGASPRVHWRFRVPDGTSIEFTDGRCGPQIQVAGRDFGDFIVWRSDGWPSYQLAVVVDDAAMHITEVVRGEDLLRSTARQLLLYRALQWTPPQFYHCSLVRDENGVRLAKRHDSLSIRQLRSQGATPESIIRRWENPAETGEKRGCPMEVSQKSGNG